MADGEIHILVSIRGQILVSGVKLSLNFPSPTWSDGEIQILVSIRGQILVSGVKLSLNFPSRRWLMVKYTFWCPSEARF